MSNKKKQNKKILYISLGIAGFVLLIVIILILIFCLPKKKKYYQCDENGNCILCPEKSNICIYENNSNCQNVCKKPSPKTQYYRCDEKGNCNFNDYRTMKDQTYKYTREECNKNACQKPPPPPKTQYYRCDENGNCILCPSKSDTCIYTDVNCNRKCQKPIQELPKIVAFIPNFSDGYKIWSIGKPHNYTHAIIGFVVPYHYYMGTSDDGQMLKMGCTTECNLSYGTYIPSLPNLNNSTEQTRTIVTQLKNQNQQIKILLSFGGWNLDNESCNYACYGDKNPLEYYAKDCTKLDDSKPKPFPSEYCLVQNVDTIADKLISLVEGINVDGIDIDFENTKVYNNPYDPKREKYKDFIINLTKVLRKKRPNLIITHSPMNAYVMSNDKFQNAYLFYTDILREIYNDIDFINVQFYNTDPEDSNPNSSSQIINTYNDIVNDIMKGDASKVVLGMCIVKENDGVCEYCYSDNCSGCRTKSNTLPKCSDPEYRFNNIITPLYNKYQNQFGGIMIWNTCGDIDGKFTNDIYTYFQSQSK